MFILVDFGPPVLERTGNSDLLLPVLLVEPDVALDLGDGFLLSVE